MAIAETVSRILAIIAGCCLMGIVLITTLNIILRRAPFHTPIMGAPEISTFLGAMLIGFALPLNQLRDGNIKVEMLHSILSLRARIILERIVLLVSGVLCIAIAWRLFDYALVLRGREEVSMTLAIPFYPFIVVTSLCFAMLAFVLLVQVIAPRDEADDGTAK